MVFDFYYNPLGGYFDGNDFILFLHTAGATQEKINGIPD